MHRILLGLFLITQIFATQAGAKPACEGYVAMDGFERGMGRAIYLGEVAEDKAKSKVTLKFVEGKKTIEAVDYDCDFEAQRCYPTTEGAEKYFPVCMTALKTEIDGSTVFYLSAYPDSKCQGLPAKIFGNIYCR